MRGRPIADLCAPMYITAVYLSKYKTVQSTVHIRLSTLSLPSHVSQYRQQSVGARSSENGMRGAELAEGEHKRVRAYRR